MVMAADAYRLGSYCSFSDGACPGYRLGWVSSRLAHRPLRGHQRRGRGLRWVRCLRSWRGGRRWGSVWVPKIWSCALTRHDALASWEPMCRILYRLLASLARLAVRSGRSKDLEIIVLRHQLAVLRRQNNRASARGGGPGPAGCDRGGPATTAASWLARHARDPAALAPTPNRPPLAPTLPGAWAALHLCGAASPHHRHGHQQPHLGLPPHHRRARRTRPPDQSIDSVENPQTAPHRPRPTAHEGYLDSVPALPGRRCL